MPAIDPALFPLVELEAVANGGNEWVALSLRLAPRDGDLAGALAQVFGTPDVFAALAPLDCVLALPTPLMLSDALLDRLPPARTVFALPGSALDEAAAPERLLKLHEAGYRLLIDGSNSPAVQPAPHLRAVSRDVSAGPGAAVLPQFGPHLAYRVDSALQRKDCVDTGFAWFTGAWPLHPDPAKTRSDGTSRKRLLTLLGLLARDAESRELEMLLKQDPALSYHLLKLVNSAAFALSMPITSFGQAINLLGRRQLQRWLQLLLYARQCEDGLPNPLLPLAALRAAQMEMLCKLQGGNREQQDMAFMTGVFSLLDVLFAMPMDEIVGALSLAPDVAAALLDRKGRLGALLVLVASPALDPAALEAAELRPETWWQSLLHAYHWAIQVSRNI